jgi:hypothetical protein
MAQGPRTRLCGSGSITRHTLTVLAARVGSYQFHPYWGLLTGLLWVRGESR